MCILFDTHNKSYLAFHKLVQNVLLGKPHVPVHSVYKTDRVNMKTSATKLILENRSIRSACGATAVNISTGLKLLPFLNILTQSFIPNSGEPSGIAVAF
ncbi:hypothetical protein T12_5037 [Trichinella patagoniensis]|uniref:Uncharacterized protein n=1 Tax=Trichinella patagoniensis TaxID=990121 RepID=A0A0V1ADN8_9BILA|nr:hypothetical protein T12_5037 [Trichinella patagoniensis]